jgi:transposase
MELDRWGAVHPVRQKLTVRPFPHAFQADIVFDKFQILKHPSDDFDEVRRREYKSVVEKDRTFIKGQRYTLLSHQANLDFPEQMEVKTSILRRHRRCTCFTCLD